jgi:hypothetical protein
MDLGLVHHAVHHHHRHTNNKHHHRSLDLLGLEGWDNTDHEKVVGIKVDCAAIGMTAFSRCPGLGGLHAGKALVNAVIMADPILVIA